MYLGYFIDSGKKITIEIGLEHLHKVKIQGI